jgi:hypothetical protein
MANWFSGTDVFVSKPASYDDYHHMWVPCGHLEIFREVAIVQIKPSIYPNREKHDHIDFDRKWHSLKFRETAEPLRTSWEA